jgi:hypothetical protein
MPEQEPRAGQLNAIIDPKLLFLAKLAARYKRQTLIEFIEEAFRQALSPAVMLEDEPTPGHERQSNQAEQLWYEALWHEDDATRLFQVAVADQGLKLLTPKQREVFARVSRALIKQGKKVTVRNFVESFNASIEDGK